MVNVKVNTTINRRDSTKHARERGYEVFRHVKLRKTQDPSSGVSHENTNIKQSHLRKRKV